MQEYYIITSDCSTMCRSAIWKGNTRASRMGIKEGARSYCAKWLWARTERWTCHLGISWPLVACNCWWRHASQSFLCQGIPFSLSHLLSLCSSQFEGYRSQSGLNTIRKPTNDNIRHLIFNGDVIFQLTQKWKRAQLQHSHWNQRCK